MPETTEARSSRQFCTFYLGDRLFGIDVRQVQEVTLPMPLTPIRLAPAYVKGLINLRGQIATAIGLKELFRIEASAHSEKMNVVCSAPEGGLLTFLVDRVGDVVEVELDGVAPSPETVDDSVRRYMDGVCESESKLLSILNVDQISKSLGK